jgi:heme exporter protein A
MILAGLLPHEGNLEFGRTKAQQEIQPTNQLIHVIAHLNAIKLELSLTENLQFWIDLSGGSTSLIPKALQNAGLSGLDNFAAGHLSAGQKHRLSLARLLVSPRPVWLLDEPSSALDAAGDKWIASLIENQLEKGGVVIAATHKPIELNQKLPLKTLTLGASS